MTEGGTLESIFVLQKALVYEIIRQAGLDPDKLSPATKAAIDKPQTTDLGAFLAFSRSLELLDQGRFQEAQSGFQRAAEIDAKFEMAARFRDSAPLSLEHAGDIAEASIKEAQQTELTPPSAGSSSSGDSEGSGAGTQMPPEIVLRLRRKIALEVRVPQWQALRKLPRTGESPHRNAD